MTYEPRHSTTEPERDVIVTPPSGPNYGGVLTVVLVAIVAIVLAVWLFADGETTTGTTSPTETTVETTIPAETTVPGGDTAPTTIAP